LLYVGLTAIATKFCVSEEFRDVPRTQVGWFSVFRGNIGS